MSIRSSTVQSILIIIFLSNCNDSMTKNNPPLAAIIKLNAAESLLNFQEAEKYQDVNSIYKKYIEDDTTQSVDIWKQFVTSGNISKNDKKFTNQTKYYNYDILEMINDKSAEVIFRSKNTEANIQSIIYKLEMEKSGWIVKDIEYRKRRE